MPSTACLASLGSDSLLRVTAVEEDPHLLSKRGHSSLLSSPWPSPVTFSPSLTLLLIPSQMKMSAQAIWINLHGPLPGGMLHPFDHVNCSSWEHRPAGNGASLTATPPPPPRPAAIFHLLGIWCGIPWLHKNDTDLLSFYIHVAVVSLSVVCYLQ